MLSLIPDEIIICDDKYPLWISKRMQKIIHEPTRLYKDDHISNDTQIFEKRFYRRSWVWLWRNRRILITQFCLKN